jgi:hypothetical protein
MLDVDNTILLTGVPRSGTTLITSLLNNYSNTVALMEPMNIFQTSIKTKEDALSYIRSFIMEARHTALHKGKVPTKQLSGNIPTNPIEEKESVFALRKAIVYDGEMFVSKTLSNDFRLIVKHNDLFTALLDNLKKSYDVYAIVRNPLNVLLSWNSVDLPVQRGRLPAGERLDESLKGRLSLENDTFKRQLIILNWFYEKFNKYINHDKVIRYEKLIENPLKTLFPLSYDGLMQTSDLKLKKKASFYGTDINDIRRIMEGVLSQRNASWQAFYTEKDVLNEYEQILSDIK